MPDNPAPRRRWFQFKLSTWFVLVAIVSWAMIEWPWVITTVDGQLPFASADWTAYPAVDPEVKNTINPRLLYPALALAAFVGGKVVWMIVERQRIRRATH